MSRVRLVHIVLQPAFVLDDGEHLSPLSVQPITISAADWPNVHARFEKATADLQAQIDGASELDIDAAEQ